METISDIFRMAFVWVLFFFVEVAFIRLLTKIIMESKIMNAICSAVLDWFLNLFSIFKKKKL